MNSETLSVQKVMSITSHLSLVIKVELLPMLLALKLCDTMELRRISSLWLLSELIHPSE